MPIKKSTTAPNPGEYKEFLMELTMREYGNHDLWYRKRKSSNAINAPRQEDKILLRQELRGIGSISEAAETFLEELLDKNSKSLHINPYDLRPFSGTHHTTPARAKALDFVMEHLSKSEEPRIYSITLGQDDIVHKPFAKRYAGVNLSGLQEINLHRLSLPTFFGFLPEENLDAAYPSLRRLHYYSRDTHNTSFEYPPPSILARLHTLHLDQVPAPDIQPILNQGKELQQVWLGIMLGTSPEGPLKLKHDTLKSLMLIWPFNELIINTPNLEILSLQFFANAKMSFAPGSASKLRFVGAGGLGFKLLESVFPRLKELPSLEIIDIPFGPNGPDGSNEQVETLRKLLDEDASLCPRLAEIGTGNTQDEIHKYLKERSTKARPLDAPTTTKKKEKKEKKNVKAPDAPETLASVESS